MKHDEPQRLTSRHVLMVERAAKHAGRSGFPEVAQLTRVVVRALQSMPLLPRKAKMDQTPRQRPQQPPVTRDHP